MTTEQEQDSPDRDINPVPGKRDWYRHQTTGERGYFVRLDGVDYIQLDRPQEIIRRPFESGEWNIETEYRPLTIAQIAQACFEADKAICRSRGLHELARRDWHGLTEEQRIKWMDRGPRNDAIRGDLWEAMMGVLRPLAR